MTFSRADTFPRAQPGDEGQVTGESEAGLVRIATLHAPLTFLVLRWAQRTSLPASDYAALGTFLQHALINFRAFPFTFTDSDGATTLVRYWAGYYGFTQTAYGLWQGTLTLRREV